MKALIIVSLQLTLLGRSALAQFGSNSYYYNNWCGHLYLPYLDDADCQKKFPSKFDRDFTCPNIFSNEGTGYRPDVPIDQIFVDNSALNGIPSAAAVDMQVIMIRRTSSGVVYKYMATGDHFWQPWETWSVSKIFAMANAGGKLRTACNYSMGLDATTFGGSNPYTPLGDLATIICSYDETQGYTSNSLSSYFHDIGHRDRLYDLVRNWMERSDTPEQLGGNYGASSPFDLGFTFTSADGSVQCDAPKDFGPTHVNTLSAYSLSEMLRRIVMHRETLAENRWPGNQWADMQTILYGAETSNLFPGLKWGGMTADTAIYTQSGLDMLDVETRSEGNWRIHSKLGAGYSYSRFVGEITYAAYACLPVVIGGNAVPDSGVEFVIAARSSVPLDTALYQAEAVIQPAVADVVAAIYDGTLQ